MSKHSKAVSTLLAMVALPLALACESDVTGPRGRTPIGPTDGARVEMRLEPGSVVLQLGATIQLRAEMTDYDGTPLGTFDREILWHSSDPDIATVNEYGLVVAHGIGAALITAESAEDVAYANVTVVPVGMIDPPYRPGRGR